MACRTSRLSLLILTWKLRKSTILKNYQQCGYSEMSPQELPYFCLIPCDNYFLHLLSQNKSHQNYNINLPKSGKNWIHNPSSQTLSPKMVSEAAEQA
jgi:hypothetical protein